MSDLIKWPFIAVKPDIKALRNIIDDLAPYSRLVSVSRHENPDRDMVIVVHPKGDYSAGQEVLFFTAEHQFHGLSTFIFPWPLNWMPPPADGAEVPAALDFDRWREHFLNFSERLDREGVESFLSTLYS